MNNVRRTTIVRWSRHPEMVEWMRGFIPGHTESEIRVAFSRRFGIDINRSQVKNFKSRFGIRSGTFGGRFEKGCTSWNKGVPQSEWMPAESIERSKATRFKRGSLPANTADIGAERVTRDGYVEVKVTERPTPGGRAHDNWISKQRMVWEAEHGRKVPSGHKVIFCDHDKTNLGPGNLMLVSSAELAVMNKTGCVWHDRETAESVLALSRLKIAKGSIERRERRCVDCGAVFTPRFAKQRRCDACIAVRSR
ncbi:MAG TPA: HNH endonuclease [Candidatus Olsenella pullicola]|nr:HNH endonuclease [Candidatus Olsenella pullicola]